MAVQFGFYVKTVKSLSKLCIKYYYKNKYGSPDEVRILIFSPGIAV